MTFSRALGTLGGGVTSAISGFALAVLVARYLGPSGAGVFFSLVAVFTIGSAVLRLGADTATLWRLPQLLQRGDLAEARRTIRLGLLPPLCLSIAAALTIDVLAGPIASLLTGGGPASDVATAQVRWTALGLGLMAPTGVLLAATRGLGYIKPFVLIQNVFVPLARLVGVAAVVGLGGRADHVMAAWVLPVVLAAGLTSLTLVRCLASEDAEPHHGQRVGRADAVVNGFWRFAVARGATASVEAVLVGVNTIVVGVLHGPAAAGIFGAMTRFVTSGTLAEQSLRILVAPRFSALLSRDEVSAASRLYSLTTSWVAMFSLPIFLSMAAGAPALLSLFGPDFVAGAAGLALLSLTMSLTQLTGNVQTVLLMSGRSGLQLFNKAAAVTVLAVGDVLLVPRWGVLGASAAWSLSLLTDAGLALAEVRYLLGLQLRPPLVGRIALAAIVALGVPTLVGVRILGAGTPGMVAGVLFGGVSYLAVLSRWRGHLHLTGDPLARSDEAEPLLSDPTRAGVR